MMTEKYLFKVTCIIMFFMTLFSGCQKKMTKDQIINIANNELISHELEPEEKLVCFDVDNKKWENKFANIESNAIKTNNFSSIKRLEVLEGRDYQAVLYSPKQENVIGGIFWVFIDKKTGEVITSFGEK